MQSKSNASLFKKYGHREFQRMAESEKIVLS